MSEPTDPFKFRGDPDLRLLRDELYDGDWQPMLEDLESRLDKRPSVYKIARNIKEDLIAIRRLIIEESKAAKAKLNKKVEPKKAVVSGTPKKKVNRKKTEARTDNKRKPKKPVTKAKSKK